ncbi:MAG: hypothetical protein F6K63_00385 [Moorea sp. SIO1G6]|uniref:hypothetical protein n=1 Tax=Moorena sp. SIO1G6 TaxID=2607840 RepID=UPI0013C1C106|nr:hypothetical protein [Moorena sp. SIO1G6]NES81087.1 hypothetical protein [Moorena sp. SIO2B7]NET62932.1 hypothetical protein [Moorena sp. SIO1G6]
MLKCAGFIGKALPDSQQLIEKMVSAQQKEALSPSHTFQLDNKGFVATLSLPQKIGRVSLQRKSIANNLLVITGAPISLKKDLEQQLSQVVESDFDTAIKVLTELDGAFVAIYWNNSLRKLAIVTDILGMQPLYVVKLPGLLLFASEVKAIAASNLIEKNINPASWGAFLSFGHFIGNQTSLQQVERISTGCVLTYDPDQDTVLEKSYWQWPEPKVNLSIKNFDTAHLIHVLKQEIAAYLEYYDNHSTTVLLSGGFDSRLLAALMVDMGVQPTALALKHEDELFGAEGYIAEKVAKQLNIPFKLISTNSDFFSSEQYLKYLIMNEVATPSLNLFIAQLVQYLNSSINSIWEACFFGAGLKRFPKETQYSLTDYLKNLPTYSSSIWQAARYIFSPSLSEQMYEEFNTQLRVEANKYSNDGFGVLQFMIRNRTRNRTAPNPLQVYNNKTFTFTPGLSKAFWNEVASLPTDFSVDYQLYRKLFQDHFADMSVFPFISGGKFANLQTLSLRNNCLNLAFRLGKKHYVRSLLKPFGLYHNNFFTPSSLVDSTISLVNQEYPDLNAVKISQIDSLFEPRCMKYKNETLLLFYWQIWHWIMDGDYDKFAKILN